MSVPIREFRAAYRRYTPEMSAALVRIAEALGTIRGARILPAVEDQLRSSARVGTVHYSNLIEGNELPLIEAERAARGQLAPDTKAKIELINYVAALDLIDARLASDSLELTTDFLLELHGVTTKGLGREDDPHFKPHHEGAWRDGTALVVDRTTNTIMHEGPPPEEVPERMERIFEWMKRKSGSAEQPYVIAGVMHWAITDVHPFADGNGRATRLFQAALLMRAGVLPGRMFSFERYYAESRDAYYRALRSVREQTMSMDSWLTYFLEGLALEYERVATTIIDLSALTSGSSGAPLTLSTTQQAAITELRISGRREFTRGDYEAIAGVGRTAALDDLGKLIRHGILKPRGSGRSSRYVFAGEISASRSASSRSSKWSDERIEADLREFVKDREQWPSANEFAAAGYSALYAAASRKGGISRWRRMFGL